MKQMKRPTRKQKILMELRGLNPDNWFIERDTPAEIVIVNRQSGKKRSLQKVA